MKLPHNALHFLFYFVREQWVKFSLFIFISVIWATSDAVFPYFLKRMINALQTYPDAVFAAVKNPLILLIVAWTVTEILNRIQGILQIATFPRFRASIRASAFDYVQAHSHEYFASHFAGNIAKKLSDLPTSCQTLMEIISFQFATAFTGSVMVLIMMWVVSPLFAGILFIWLCLHLGLTSIFLRFGNHLWATHADAVSTLSGKIVDTFSNMLNVRLFARCQYESEYLKKYQREEMHRSKKAMWAMEITRMGLGLSGLFLIFGMLFGLLYEFSKHAITLGDFTQIAMQAFWILGWIWFASYQMTVFAREMGTINSALSVIRKKHDLIDAPHAHKLTVSKGEICFDHVGFKYAKNTAVFHDLNITLPAGKTVGLVGFSGSGKSTFVNLILRFYDVQSGRILIDGQDIAHVTQTSLRSQIAMIPQDPALFHRSLMENIRYGNLEATDAEVIAASRDAHCHEFIETLEDGYQSLVGERGIKLSGGQRQRIAIARAILKNAPILILDEATSSLDSVTEKLIQDSLHRLMQNRTTLVIAHRLSTLSNMDNILVFHKGQIVESGTQADLLEKNGHFAKLWQLQTHGFLPDEETSNH